MTAAALLLAAAFVRPLERVVSMDPAMAQSIYDSRAIQLVYETPLAVDYASRPYRLVAGACELPEVSEDGRTYVFRMRSAELEAADVVRALERLRDPSVLSPNAWMVKEVDTVRARDAHTVEVRLKARQHVFPWIMAMSGAAIRRADGTGTGPYELTRWRKNHAMIFHRRAIPPPPPPPTSTSHLNPAPPFDEIRYLVVDDVSTQWLMFLKGELDFLGEVSRDNWDAVVGADGRLDPALVARGVTLHTYPTLDTMYIGFNMNDPVVGPNRKLRQALNAAFDAPAWTRFYSGRIVPADGPVPPGVAGRLETPFAYAYDLGKAKRLLAEAGYAGGIDPKTGRRLVLEMAVGRATQDSREAGELIAAFWARLGIRLEMRFYTWDAFLKAVNEGRTQLFRMGWVGDYPDAENFLQLFHSKNVSPGPNHGGYANAAFDAAYDAAMAEPTEEGRGRHWRTCQEIVREDCPWVFTHFNKANSLTGPRVGGYVPGSFPYGEEQYFHENPVP